MWNIVSYILNIVLLIWAVYLYIENRKFKRFETEKDFEIKETEIEELHNELKRKIREKEKEMAGRGLSSSGIKEQEIEELKNEYDIKIKKLHAELRYLDKLRHYKWIFSKPYSWDLDKLIKKRTKK